MEYLKVLGSTGEVTRIVWEDCMLLPDRFIFCWCMYSSLKCYICGDSCTGDEMIAIMHNGARADWHQTSLMDFFRRYALRIPKPGILIQMMVMWNLQISHLNRVITIFSCVMSFINSCLVWTDLIRILLHHQSPCIWHKYEYQSGMCCDKSMWRNSTGKLTVWTCVVRSQLGFQLVELFITVEWGIFAMQMSTVINSVWEPCSAERYFGSVMYAAILSPVTMYIAIRRVEGWHCKVYFSWALQLCLTSSLDKYHPYYI